MGKGWSFEGEPEDWTWPSFTGENATEVELRDGEEVIAQIRADGSGAVYGVPLDVVDEESFTVTWDAQGFMGWE